MTQLSRSTALSSWQGWPHKTCATRHLLSVSLFTCLTMSHSSGQEELVHLGMAVSQLAEQRFDDIARSARLRAVREITPALSGQIICLAGT